jgi:hypothetical protein
MLERQASLPGGVGVAVGGAPRVLDGRVGRLEAYRSMTLFGIGSQHIVE